MRVSATEARSNTSRRDATSEWARPSLVGIESTAQRIYAPLVAASVQNWTPMRVCSCKELLSAETRELWCADTMRNRPRAAQCSGAQAVLDRAPHGRAGHASREMHDV